MTSRIIALLFLLLLSLPARAGEGDYLTRLRGAVAEWEREIPALDKSAAQAAGRLTRGGHLYVTGTQPSFADEACGRSGGLMIAQGLGTDALGANDVVVFGEIPAGDKAALEALRQRVQAAGAQLVVFSSGKRAAGETAFPVHPTGAGVESTSNVAGMWAWMGQLIYECISRGKTPTIFESIFMPGGTTRDNSLKGHPFHDRGLGIDKNFPALGREYLDGLDHALAQVAHEGSALRAAKTLLAQTHAAGRGVTVFYLGHMFPKELSSAPVPNWIAAAAPNTVPSANTLALDLGYQWFPWEVPALTGAQRIPSIIVTSKNPTPDWTTDATHVYLDPFWQVQDATVTVPGYDIKALPASGVLESAIFWELVEGL